MDEKQMQYVLQKSELNYRDFLKSKVKFKKVVDFSAFKTEASNEHNQESQADQIDIEERIHINYRLQYLKDTVMARYIDD